MEILSPSCEIAKLFKDFVILLSMCFARREMGMMLLHNIKRNGHGRQMQEDGSFPRRTVVESTLIAPPCNDAVSIREVGNL